MGIAMIVSDEASHAFHSLQKSSQADDAKNLFHIYPGSEGIVIHQQPNSWERKIEKLFFFSWMFNDKTIEIANYGGETEKHGQFYE